MLKVDTRGMSCPQPVLMTKKGLEGAEKGIEVFTDSHSAIKNIKRFAIDNGYIIDEKKEDDFVILVINK